MKNKSTTTTENNKQNHNNSRKLKTYILANIRPNNMYFDKIDQYAYECKNIYNSTLYEYRQNFFHQE